MPNERKREWALTAIVAGIALFLMFKTIHLSLGGGAVGVTISQNDGGLSTLDSPKKIVSTQHIDVDRLDFPEGSMLEHAQYGKLGYTQDFFIDAETVMQVTQADTYRFEIRSDDGFSLTIDGRKVCEFRGNRPMRSTTCNYRLGKGRHLLKLSYFQGGGPMGLEAHYRRAKGTNRFVGDDSDGVIFEKAAK